jgi:actin-like ATPase involved in cell morphogenesis
MATGNSNATDELRRRIETEREELATAVDTLRAEIGEVTNVSAKLKAKLPAVAAGALGAGFVLAGGIGATMRLFARKSREGTEKARFGPFRLVGRD